MMRGIWWGRTILIAMVSFFFLVFGIETLIGSFSFTNPLEFIVCFFAASFMVLISIVGIIYPTIQVYALFKPLKRDND